MVSDQEPRYRLVDSNGVIRGTLYGKPDGSIAIQETDSGADREVALAPDGTFSAPSVETDSVSTKETHTETIGAGDYHYAGDYDGSDADARLDNALSAASDGDVIYLEAADYTDDRTINKRLIFIGSMVGTSGTRFDGATITVDERCKFEHIFIESAGAKIIFNAAIIIFSDGIVGAQSEGLEVNDDNVMIYGVTGGGDVIFNDGTSEGIVDASTNVTVTDNGNNTVGDVA